MNWSALARQRAYARRTCRASRMTYRDLRHFVGRRRRRPRALRGRWGAVRLRRPLRRLSNHPFNDPRVRSYAFKENAARPPSRRRQTHPRSPPQRRINAQHWQPSSSKRRNRSAAQCTMRHSAHARRRRPASLAACVRRARTTRATTRAPRLERARRAARRRRRRGRARDKVERWGRRDDPSRTDTTITTPPRATIGARA